MSALDDQAVTLLSDAIPAIAQRRSRPSPRSLVVVAAAIAAALAISLLVHDAFVLTLAGYTCAFSLFALSINVMLGWLGEVPLGQSLFFGIGAYGAAAGMLKLGLPFEVSVVMAIVVSVVVAAGIGALTLKLTGAYFSIVSWGLAGVAVVAALNLDAITGGPLGLFGFPRLKVGPVLLTEPREYFLVTAAVLVISVVILHAMHDSKFGQALESIRQNRHLAQSLGVHVSRERRKALMLSAPFAAVAGALCVPYTQIVTPDVFSVNGTVEALVMVLLGGSGLLVGPIIGAAIFSILPNLLQLEPNAKILAFSTLIILIMIFAPGGLHEIGKRVLARWRP